MKRILVLGVTRYVGKAFLALLGKDKTYSVNALSRRELLGLTLSLDEK